MMGESAAQIRIKFPKEWASKLGLVKDAPLGQTNDHAPALLSQTPVVRTADACLLRPMDEFINREVDCDCFPAG